MAKRPAADDDPRDRGPPRPARGTYCTKVPSGLPGASPRRRNWPTRYSTVVARRGAGHGLRTRRKRERGCGPRIAPAAMPLAAALGSGEGEHAHQTNQERKSRIAQSLMTPSILHSYSGISVTGSSN